MENENKLNKFLDGLGVIAKTTYAAYKAFLIAGFYEAQAFTLAYKFMNFMLTTSKNGEEEQSHE